MENIDSGWERKEWECVGSWRGKGCGWKGFGSECHIVDYFELIVKNLRLWNLDAMWNIHMSQFLPNRL